MTEAYEPRKDKDYESSKTEHNAEAEKLSEELAENLIADATTLAEAGSKVTIETDDEAYFPEITEEGTLSLFQNEAIYHILQRSQQPFPTVEVALLRDEDGVECRAICGLERRLRVFDLSTAIGEGTLRKLNWPVCPNCLNLWKENPKRAALAHSESARKGKVPPFDWKATVIVERQGESE